MSLKIHSFATSKTTTWSGGETREYFVYPPESNYAERNFEFRISTATIEVEESDFTSLPNYNRELIVLEGKLELIHENHHSKALRPFEKDSFSGSWKTKSIGLARDFNVIYSDEWKLETELIQTSKAVTISTTADFCFLLFLDRQFMHKLLVEEYDLVEFDLGQFEFINGVNCMVISISKQAFVVK